MSIAECRRFLRLPNYFHPKSSQAERLGLFLPAARGQPDATNLADPRQKLRNLLWLNGRFRRLRDFLNLKEDRFTKLPKFVAHMREKLKKSHVFLLPFARITFKIFL